MNEQVEKNDIGKNCEKKICCCKREFVGRLCITNTNVRVQVTMCFQICLIFFVTKVCVMWKKQKLTKIYERPQNKAYYMNTTLLYWLYVFNTFCCYTLVHPVVQAKKLTKWQSNDKNWMTPQSLSHFLIMIKSCGINIQLACILGK